ncbi:MAG: lipopolysaccharide heptosyltransferase I [Vicinamibacterales bacterium]
MTAFLIVRLGALGDIVHAIPVVAALLRAHPDARIDWLVDPRYVTLVQMVEGVRKVIPFDPRGLMAASERAATLATIRDLRRERYDAVLDLQGLVKSASVARLASGRRTIGFGRSALREPAARVFYTDVVDVPGDVHVIRKNLALLAAVGIQATEPEFGIRVPESPHVSSTIARFQGSGYVAMNPGAAWPNKRWPAERMGELAFRTSRDHHLPTLVVWGPGEEALAESVVTASGGAATLAPPTTIEELFGLLRGARLVVAGDTGPLHIAASTGTPVVALFGPTDPARNGPWRLEDVSVSRYGVCDCHYERRCRRSVPCVMDIGVDEVMAAVSARLSAGGMR